MKLSGGSHTQGSRSLISTNRRENNIPSQVSLLISLWSEDILINFKIFVDTWISLKGDCWQSAINTLLIFPRVVKFCCWEHPLTSPKMSICPNIGGWEVEDLKWQIIALVRCHHGYAHFIGNTTGLGQRYRGWPGGVLYIIIQIKTSFFLLCQSLGSCPIKHFKETLYGRVSQCSGEKMPSIIRITQSMSPRCL